MAAAAATRRAAPSSMAGVDVASTSAQALLQAGLQQDIFARARSGATEAAASSQSSSSSLMSASCAGLTVSGILSVAQDTMPSPLRPPETSWHAASGLHNSGNWLTGSGNFQFGVSGAGFPFFPPLPETPAPDHGAHGTMHPPLPQLSMPPATPASTEHKGVWKQASSASSASAPSPSVPRTSVVRPQAMNNFYHCKADQRGEQAMAFWRLSSAELVQYNESFGTLLDVPAATLQDGYLWCNIQVVDQDMRIVTLQDEGNNALKAVQEFTGLVMAGTARYSQISFSFLSGRGRLKHMHVTMVAFHEDVLWICSEIGGDSSFRAPAPRRPQQAAQQLPSALSASGDSMPLLPPGPNDRKLVKVATRKKKPWDQNLVKFSLKKMRKRSKRKADQPL